jgi:hypothetical protein
LRCAAVGGRGRGREFLWFGRGRAIFLQELLRGVVFGGLLEALDGGIALFVEGGEGELGVGDAVVIVGC